MSSAISICSIPKNLQSTDIIFLYSVLNKCGIKVSVAIMICKEAFAKYKGFLNITVLTWL